MIVSFDLPSLLLQGSRAVVFLMGCLALGSGIRYKKPWRVGIFVVILVCYIYLIIIPIGGPGRNPNSNPPSVVNIVLNFAFAVLFWRTSGQDDTYPAKRRRKPPYHDPWFPE